MARLARIVIPGLPHHVTQRGNGRQQTFFSDADYARYRDLLAFHCRAASVDIWAWCLMPNHVHLILVPQDADGIRRALSKVHRVYAGAIHAREQRTGHFWQGRFGSVALDEDHLVSAFRYVALNPVRAHLAQRAEDWPWASTRAYLDGESGSVTSTASMLSRYPDMASLFENPQVNDKSAFERLRQAEAIGRPLGGKEFIETLSAQLGRTLAPGKRGRKRKENFIR
jgi:putative transposase